MEMRSYSGTLTVNADHTSGTNTIPLPDVESRNLSGDRARPDPPFLRLLRDDESVASWTKRLQGVKD
jgi:hypothetical protein